MSCFKILDFNYCFDNKTDLIATSEDPNFPVSNLRHPFRSKVWRTSGFYKITSDNQFIDFKDTILGSELTATISVGDYSFDELETEISTQMALVGGFDYDVTFSSSSGLWTIESSNTEFEILFNTGTNASDSARDVIGFGDNDFTGDTTYTGPSIAIHTEEAVVIDILTTEAIDAVAVIFDKDVEISLSSQAVLTIEASATNFWDSPPVSQVLTINNDFKVATFYWDTDQNYRYWRLKIEDSKNPNLFIEIPKIYLAKAVQMSRGPEVGFDEKVDDKSKIETTPYGNVYSDLFPNIRSMSFDYKVLPEEDLTTLFEIYNRVGTSGPLVIVLDAEQTIFSDKDRYFIYGHFDSDFGSKQEIRNIFNTAIRVVELL